MRIDDLKQLLDKTVELHCKRQSKYRVQMGSVSFRRLLLLTEPSCWGERGQALQSRAS